MIRYIAIALMVTLATTMQAQTKDTPETFLGFGTELQVYPAGTIAGLRFELSKGHHDGNLRVGYNRAKRKDWGEHDDEQGGGWGGTLGYRYYFKKEPKGFFLGVRSDVWNLNIDWKQGIKDDDPLNDTAGSTRILVVQPVAEAGWQFIMADTWFLAPSISFGWEINVQTEGQAVGQGSILLGGITAGYLF